MNTLSLRRDSSPSPLLLDHASRFYINRRDWGGVQRLNEAQWTSWNVVSIGFVQSLEFLKQWWNFPSNFQGLKKVWKMEIKCGKMIKKSLEFFRQYFCCSASWRKALFLYWSPIQYPWVWKKKLLLWKKVWKKYWILNPKICTNAVSMQTRLAGPAPHRADHLMSTRDGSLCCKLH